MDKQLISAHAMRGILKKEDLIQLIENDGVTVYYNMKELEKYLPADKYQQLAAADDKFFFNGGGNS